MKEIYISGNIYHVHDSKIQYYKDVNILYTDLLIQCHIPRVMCVCVCVCVTT